MNEEMEMTGFIIDDDDKADWALRKIAEAEAEYDRLADLADTRIAELEARKDAEATRRDNAVEPLQAALQAYFATVKPSTNTKTQTTYRLLSGTLVQKKAKQTMKVNDTDAFLNWMEANGYHDLIKRTPQWGVVKRSLQMFDKVAVDSATGAVVDGVEVVDEPGEFQVKVKKGV